MVVAPERGSAAVRARPSSPSPWRTGDGFPELTRRLESAPKVMREAPRAGLGGTDPGAFPPRAKSRSRPPEGPGVVQSYPRSRDVWVHPEAAPPPADTGRVGSGGAGAPGRFGGETWDKPAGRDLCLRVARSRFPPNRGLGSPRSASCLLAPPLATSGAFPDAGTGAGCAVDHVHPPDGALVVALGLEVRLVHVCAFYLYRNRDGVSISERVSCFRLIHDVPAPNLVANRGIDDLCLEPRGGARRYGPRDHTEPAPALRGAARGGFCASSCTRPSGW